MPTSQLYSIDILEIFKKKIDLFMKHHNFVIADIINDFN
jgi:hypothetical protein